MGAEKRVGQDIYKLLVCVLGFLTRRQDSEAETTEHVKDIPRKRDGECVVNEERAWSKAWGK